ncbi:MAG: OmpA family protein [candidate division WOR-3 bacterium]|nr:OmpA family protein [candidate division WOR-3 bacterium]
MKFLGWIIALIFIAIFILFYNFKYLPVETERIKQTDENRMWQTQIQELKKAKEQVAFKKVFTFDELFPGPTSFSLMPKSETALRAIVPELQKLSGAILICGHTDNTTVISSLRNKYPTNWEYSTAKAIVVLKYLESLGIKSERLVATGYADTRPIEDNKTKAGRQKNRRVEIIVRSP